jgi:hypothetical protein
MYEKVKKNKQKEWQQATKSLLLYNCLAHCVELGQNWFFNASADLGIVLRARTFKCLWAPELIPRN